MCIERIGEYLPLKKISTFTYEYSNYIPAAIAILAGFAESFIPNQFKIVRNIIWGAVFCFYVIKFANKCFKEKSQIPPNNNEVNVKEKRVNKEEDENGVKRKVTKIVLKPLAIPVKNLIGDDNFTTPVILDEDLVDRKESITTEELNDELLNWSDNAREMETNEIYIKHFIAKIATIFTYDELLDKFEGTDLGKKLFNKARGDALVAVVPTHRVRTSNKSFPDKNFFYGHFLHYKDKGVSEMSKLEVLDCTIVYILTQIIFNKQVASKFNRSSANKLEGELQDRSIIANYDNIYLSKLCTVPELFDVSLHWKN